MKMCPPSGKSKDSLKVSAFVQSQSLLALNITLKSKPLCPSCPGSCLTGLTLRTYACYNVQLHRFALTDSSFSEHISDALGKAKK